MFFATAIIVLAYLPLFAFQRVERKLFSPMAYAVGYSLAGALLVALALIPALALFALRKPRKASHPRALRWLLARYEQALQWLLEMPRRALWPAAAAIALAIALSLAVGREFLPQLDEGSLWLQVQLPPGISLAKATQMANEVRETARQVPEVTHMVTQLGRTDDGMDPWTPSHIEAFVGLQREVDKRQVVEALSARFQQLPGVTVGFSQPILAMVHDKIARA